VLWQSVYGAAREINVRVYDAAGLPPHFPKGEHTVGAGLAPVTSRPRETALCLSYYGERNLPRTRGRIYFCPAIGQNLTLDSVRPGLGSRNELLRMAQGIADLGGPDVDWSWRSRVGNDNGPVKTAYVDDEWDTIRSRGLDPSTRNILVVNE
jgi:hypothetical protein